MTKSIHSRKKPGPEEGLEETDGAANGRNAKQAVGRLRKLTSDEISATKAAQEQVARMASHDNGGRSNSSEARAFSVKQRFSAPQAAREAAKQLAELTSLKFDSVSAVDKKELGWHVTVNLVELSRIPHSTDVLASYQVNLDSEGNLESYHRGPRYLRDQIGEDL